MVKVYIAEVSPLADDSLYRKLYERAPVDRRTKADSFLFQKDKMLSIGAWTLLCYALGQEGITEFSVGLHENGKPYLVGRPELCFNLSHSGRMAMCAVAEQEVGCDVEQRATLDPALAEHVMTAEERGRIYSSQDPGEQEEMFFRLWTLKESYMKAVGAGMQLAPDSFGISFENGRISVRGHENDWDYFFKEYQLDDGYCYTCCSLSERFADDMTRVDLREL